MIKTLVALVVAMSAGAFALRLIESEPIKPSIAAVASPFGGSSSTSGSGGQAEVPFEGTISGQLSASFRTDWTTIVLHSSTCDVREALSQAHFVARAEGDRLLVAPTHLWAAQQDSNHIYGDMRRGSVSVFVHGDFSRSRLSASQDNELRSFLSALQNRLGVPNGKVYTHGVHLSGRTRTCGVVAGR